MQKMPITSVFQLGSFLIWRRIQFPGLEGSMVFSSNRKNNCLTQNKEHITELEVKKLPFFSFLSTILSPL